MGRGWGEGTVTGMEIGLVAVCGVLMVALDKAQRHVKRLQKLVKLLNAEIANERATREEWGDRA